MAITRLRHQKESKNSGKNQSYHLKNAIFYIMQKEKTREREWIGGNSGSTPEEVYRIFLETKQRYGKMNGRQGYHFIISFKPGETTIDIANEIVGEFCEQYLGDQYDYVYAIHDDKPHLHGHIEFNSIDREKGYKWHYKKGDWEKYIQPITDRLCKKYHISEILFEEKKSVEPQNEKKNKVGVSYKEWKDVKDKKILLKEILKEDIDTAIFFASTFTDFLQEMKKTGYIVRIGESQKYGTYLSFSIPGKKAVRNYRLGKMYFVEEIKKRILKKSEGKYLSLQKPPKIHPFKMSKMDYYERNSLTGISLVLFYRYYCLSPNKRWGYKRKPEDWKCIREIQMLSCQCIYLLNEGITSEKQLKERKQELDFREKKCKRKLELIQNKEQKEIILKEQNAIREEKRLIRGIMRQDVSIPEKKSKETVVSRKEVKKQNGKNL